MLVLLVTVAASFVLTMWLVQTSSSHARLSADHDVSGPQKFHLQPVPRVGGLGILAGLALGALTLWWQNEHAGRLALLLLLCGLPAFAAGIAEDLTKRVTPEKRLVASALSAALAILALDAAIRRTAIPGLDWVVASAAGAALLTVFAVAGVANAINLIDGFNGLASLCVVLMLAGLAAVAFAVGDREVVVLALVGAAAVLGFFVWNFPAGRVFLGDGGAYFLGFYLAEVAILLLVRNPQVSPLCPLLLVAYPVLETLFSMYRRRVLKGRPMGRPDGAHLHSLIYRRFMRPDGGAALTPGQAVRRNSMTSPYLWALCSVSVVPAVLWWDRTPLLAASMAAFAVLYLTLYWRIVRFHAPRWMVSRR
jgi:UDP-N-acetylmuramyl pentapeptide phosphotransferase/UDP-N-acetylglucosamine-1-phosphate transferase